MEFTFKNGDDFIQVVRQITPAASKDEERPALQLVKIECVDDVSPPGNSTKVLRFLASDGYVLAAAVAWAECDEAIPLGWYASVQAKDLADVVHGRVKEIRKAGVSLDFAENGAWTYQVGQIQGRFIQDKEGRHPNFQKLFDSVEGLDESDPSVCLGPKTAPFISHLAKVSERPLDVWLNPKPEGPILIRSGVTFSALVMPVRHDASLYVGFAETPALRKEEIYPEGLVSLG